MGGDESPTSPSPALCDLFARAAAAVASADGAAASDGGAGDATAADGGAADRSVVGRAATGGTGGSAAARAAGGRAAAAVRGERSTPAGPADLRSLPTGQQPDAVDVDLPAITYQLPKSLGSSLGWTDADRVPLCEAWLQASGDPIAATGRCNEQLWADVHKVWEAKMTQNKTLRVARNASALEKQFKKIQKGVSLFTSHYLAVKNMHTTGNLTEEDLISGAVARYCSLDIYDAIRNDREVDKRENRSAKRKAKVANCKWLACWRVLRHSDKFSGTSNVANVGSDDSDHSDAESGSTSSPSTRKKPYQRAPSGVKAAKQQRLEDIRLEKEVKASTEAVQKLTAAQEYRTALCFFQSA